MTDYFGIITKYFDDRLEYRSDSTSRYFICDTVVLWDSYYKTMYIGAANSSDWSFVYKAPYSRLYIVTDKLEPENLDPGGSLTVYMDDICKAIAGGGITGLSALYDILFMDKVL